MLKEMVARHRQERDAARGRRSADTPAMAKEMEEMAESMAYQGKVRRAEKKRSDLALASRAPGKLKFKQFLNKGNEDADA